MQDAEVQAFREIHDDLVTAVRVHEPVKRDLSAHPLVLQWCSRQTRQQKHVVVAFNVRKPPWDVVMLQLETLDAHNGRHCPFVLRMQSPPAVFSLQSLRSDIEFCHALAREASDWVLFRLTVGDLGAEFASFRIVERNELNRQALRQSAEEMKQIQRAAKAAKLAQGLAAQKKRKKRAPGKRQSKGKGQGPLAAPGAQDISDAEWGSASCSLSQEEDAIPAAGHGAASSSAAGPAGSSPTNPGASSLSAGHVGSKRQKQARAIPWGPFQLAPIVPASGHSGWGAICGQHCDRGNTLSCKKAVSRGALSDSECILRLKRWLLAGCSDSGWPIHRQRSHHVELGSKGLQEFADGMSEAEMDAIVAAWT